MRSPAGLVGVVLSSLLALLVAPAFVISCRADEATSVTILFDAASVAESQSAANDHVVSPTLGPFEKWAHLDELPNISIPTATPESLTSCVAATDRKSRAGLEIVSKSDQPLHLRIVTRLSPGLWSVDAVIVNGVNAADPAAPADQPVAPSLSWRMESILRPATGETGKAMTLLPGQALFLRWSETGAAAVEARRAVRRACWTTADSALQDLVSGALMPVDDILDALPILIERGDRVKITRRVHTALLAIAKAQALWDNGRGASDRDSAFTALVTALSEVSCADFDLVPAQRILTATDGSKPGIRVALTNAGTRTIPLVALGVENTESGQGSDMTVFRSVPPGATVVARFPVADPTVARGIVQFISDYGAATVPACPDAPVPAEQ